MILLIFPILLPVLAGLWIETHSFRSDRARDIFTLSAVLLNTALIAVICITAYPSAAAVKAASAAGAAAAEALNAVSATGTAGAAAVSGVSAAAGAASVPSLFLLHIADGIELKLKCDGLSIVFLALIGFLWPLASSYAFEYMEHEAHKERFFAFYTMSYGITAGVALSGNLITMYLFYELLTLATVPLVAHEGDVRGTRAARKYIVYSIGGAAMSFVGIMIFLTCAGSADFIYGGISGTDACLYANMAVNTAGSTVGNASGSAVENIAGTFIPEIRRKLLTACMLMFLGFGVKSAVFPFHGWLPSASVAPTPVTALLHAVAVVKSGVFASIRTVFYAFGPELLSGTLVQAAMLIISGFTILYGSCMALKEQHLKRRLAYSTVSNLSYILLGMALLTETGLQAGLSHMLFHGLMKITLFFCAGTVLCKTGREYVFQMEGLGRKMPVTFITFTIASLALTGAPLLPGFISKMNLLNEAADAASATVALSGASSAAGSISAGSVSAAAGQLSSGISGAAMFGVIALILSALLTAAYLLPLCVRAFLVHKDPGVPAPVYTDRDRDPGRRMTVPFLILCIAMLILGFCSTGIMAFLEALI